MTHYHSFYAGNWNPADSSQGDRFVTYNFPSDYLTSGCLKARGFSFPSILFALLDLLELQCNLPFPSLSSLPAVLWSLTER